MKKIFLFTSLAIQSLWGSVNLENSKEVIQKIIDANFQKNPELTMLQLYNVDRAFFDKVANEVLTLIDENQPSYATKSGHASNWSKPQGTITQFSLLNVSGILDDYSTDHNLSTENKKFAYGNQYPHLKQFIALFPHATNFRINVLHEKSRFTQHEEDICIQSRITGKPALKVRFHLPILTNDQAVMVMQGDLYHYNPSTIYFFHNGCIHDGVNLSETQPRVHLLWDMLLTEDTY